MNWKSKTLLPNIITILMGAYIILRPTHDIYNTIVLAFYILWIVASCINNTISFVYCLKNSCCFVMIGLAFFIFTTGVLKGGIVYTAKQALFTVLYFMPIVLFYSLSSTNTRLQQITLTRVFLVLFCATSVAAYFYYTVHVEAARSMAWDLNCFGFNAIGGGYCFSYCLMILMIYLLSIPYEYKRHIIPGRALWVIMSLVFIMTIIKTASTIITLSTIVGIVFIVFFRLNTRNRVIAVACAIVILLIVWLYNTEIGSFLLTITVPYGTTYTKRVHAIGEYLIKPTSSDDNHLALRLNLVRTSWRTFLTSPLIGVGYKYGYVSDLELENGIGRHSEIFDCLAKYGIIGTGLEAVLYKIGIINPHKKNKAVKALCNPAYIICFVMLALLNQVMFLSVGFTLFFVIPTIQNAITGLQED